jgi:hypothetical protein
MGRSYIVMDDIERAHKALVAAKRPVPLVVPKPKEVIVSVGGE